MSLASRTPFGDRASNPSTAAGRSIPWRFRLEVRVLVYACLVAGVSLAALVVASRREISEHSRERFIQELGAAKTAFEQLVDSKARFAAAQVRLVAELPVFRAHLSDPAIVKDAATVHAMVQHYRAQLGAQFCLVTHPNGTRIGDAGWPDSFAPPEDVRSGIAAASIGRSHRTVVPLAGQLFLVVSEPAAFGDEILGALTAGYRLDDEVAGELSRVTRFEVNFVCGTQLCASHLPQSARGDLQSLLKTDARPLGDDGAQTLIQLGAARYQAGVYPLSEGRHHDLPARLVLLQNWAPTEHFLDQIRQRLVGLGAVIFLLVVAGNLFLSRRLIHPLQQIVEAARDIAGGNWSRRLPAQNNAEATVMAAAFNEMTESLCHWRAQATSREKQLQTAFQKFRAVTQSAKGAIVSADSAGLIIFWNRSAEATFGYAESEALGTPFLALIAPGSWEGYGRALEQVESGSDGSPQGQTFELAAIRKDGNEFPVELALATWTAEGSRCLTAIIRDITERKRMEAETARRREDGLRQMAKMEAIGRLAGGVAHDFNNMLTVINGHTEILLASHGGDPSVREDLEQIRNAGERAASLTRQLLAFSRKQVLAPQVLDLSGVVKDTEKMLRRLIGEDIELATAAEPGLGPVRADPGQIEQILMNLAVNARDAMPDGGRLRIELKNERLDESSLKEYPSARPGPFVMVAVSDNGCGMGSETLSHIFEPFFTTKGQGKGTGLGLATVYGIVEQCGGAIQVESAPGQGSTFRIYLPRVDQAEETQVSRAAGPSLECGSETVLLAEDEGSLRTLISSVLQQSGYKVLEARGGQEALALSGSHRGPIDLLLTDVVMPGMSGRELAESVVITRPAIKLLFMSGYTDDAAVVKKVRESGTAFIQKPFLPTSLARKVREVLTDATAAGPQSENLALIEPGCPPNRQAIHQAEQSRS